MRRKTLLILLLLPLVSSCSLLCKDKGISQEHEFQPAGSSLTEANYVSYGQIVNADMFFSGNDILVPPFSVALDIEDSEELRQASLMAVRGVIDVFESCYAEEDGHFSSCQELTEYEKGNYNLIFSRDQEGVDFILEGRITESMGGGIFGIPFIQKKKILVVEGKITENGTGNVIAIFQDRIEAATKQEAFSDLARRSGQNIGQFIFTIIKQSAY